MPTQTIAQQLQKLITAKSDIANAIIAKGGTVSSGDGFEEFPADIDSISGNSGLLTSIHCNPMRDKRTSWTTKTWSGLTSFDGQYIWTDGENIYYSSDSTQYVLDKSTSTWTTKTWTGLTSFRGGYVWTDGERVYYSRNAYSQYVLDKANRDWQTSVIDFQGYTLSDPTLQLFTDGVDIYMNSRGSAGSDNVLLKYDKAMWTFEVVSYPFEYKGPGNMISKFMVCPSCRYKGLPSAIGNINPNTDNIYNRVSSTSVVTMDKIEVE